MTTPCSSALLVHGAGGGAWEWKIWLGVLRAHGLDAHAPELHPAPDGLAATFLRDYETQVRKYLLTLASPRVLVGASLGGLIAAMCSGDADALILINPVPPRPWHLQMPAREWSPVVPWHRNSRLAGTRASLCDADDASALFAFRHWRDESGGALRSAWEGVEVAAPACPALFLVSTSDHDVPSAVSLAMASSWNAEVQMLASSHAGPLLGERAAEIAGQAVAWLNHRLANTTNSSGVSSPAH